MLKIKYIDKIIRGHKAAGVECILSGNGQATLAVSVLKKEGSKVEITDSAESLDNFDSLSELLPTGIPAMLAVNGKGVFHKKVSRQESDTLQSLVHKALPGADPGEFYIQQVPVGENQVFISVIRKTPLDNILNTLTQKRITVVNCSLGPFIIRSLLPLVTCTNDTIRLNGYSLKIIDNQIQEYHLDTAPDKDETVTVSGNSINSAVAIPYLSALTFFIPGTKTPQIESEKLKNAKEEFFQKRIFRTSSVASIAFFFFLLLVNSSLYMTYSGEKDVLQAKVMAAGTITAKYDSLKKAAGAKRIFLNQYGFADNLRLSFYSDRLAGGLPETITLTELNLFPVRKKTSNESNITFRQDTVLISGLCPQSVYLDNWIEQLTNEEWIGNINLANYSQDKSEIQANFRLELILK